VPTGEAFGTYVSVPKAQSAGIEVPSRSDYEDSLFQFGSDSVARVRPSISFGGGGAASHDDHRDGDNDNDDRESVYSYGDGRASEGDGEQIGACDTENRMLDEGEGEQISARDTEKRMLDEIAAAQGKGPRAVVDAMLKARTGPTRGADSTVIQKYLADLPLSAACVMNQGFAVISELLRAFPGDVQKKDLNSRTALSWAAQYNYNSAVIAELLSAYEFHSIGVVVSPDSPGQMRVTALTAGGAADRSGLIKIGDIVSSLGSRGVTGRGVAFDDNPVIVDSVRAPLTLDVIRDSDSITVNVVRDANSSIGIGLAKDNLRRLRVTALAPGGPAECSGLIKIGDIVSRVGSHDTAGLGPADVKPFVSGAVGTTLTMVIVRPHTVQLARESMGKDSSGCLPLHYAARWNSSKAVVAELLKVFPDHAHVECKHPEFSGWLPLHFAAKFNPNEAVVATLLVANPSAAQQTIGDESITSTDVGISRAASFTSFKSKQEKMLPLSLAACFNPNVAIIKSLVRAYPEGDRPGRDNALTKFFSGKSHDAAIKALAADPDLAFISQEFMNACLPWFATMDDLPGNLMKSSKHPLHASLEISAALMRFSHQQRSNDIRLAQNADEKASQLEHFACAIARHAPPPSRPSPGLDVSQFGLEMEHCLKLAADLKLKFFISEPACSRCIEALWWKPLEGEFSRSEDLKKFAFSFFWWVCNIILNVKKHHPPACVRFLMNRASYFAFLVCLLQLPQLPLQFALGDPDQSMRLEIFLAYWLFDICVAEAFELRDIMKRHHISFLKSVTKYAEDPWNIYDAIALSVGVAAACVRASVRAGGVNVTETTSNQLYAWALALLWGRLVNVLSVVSFIGPLLIMVLVMVFKDLTKFAVLVVTIELPFVAALYFLESGGGNEAFATFQDSSLSFFKILIGQGPDISSVTASSSVLLSFGTVLLSVLLLNLLIAMFSKTFDTIVENSTQEYLLQKAQLTFAWTRAPRMPPPFTLSFALRDWGMNQLARRVFQNEKFKKYFAGWKQQRRFDDFQEPDEPLPPNFDELHFSRILPRSSNFREEALKDWKETSDSSRQIDKFMQTAVTQQQMKDLSDIVQFQQKQINAIHANTHQILQKLNPGAQKATPVEAHPLVRGTCI